MLLTVAHAHARRESTDHACVKHVCYQRGYAGAPGTYIVSDWYDGSTVASYDNGRLISGDAVLDVDTVEDSV